jgi:hypothetical protein
MTETAQPQIKRYASWNWLVWLFASLGAVTAIAVIWLAFILNGSYRPAEVAKVNAAAPPGKIYAIGHISELYGTDNLAVEINLMDDNGRSGIGSSKGGDYGDQRNLLLVNRKTGASNRLLPNNNREIVGIRYFAMQAGTGWESGYGQDDVTNADVPLAYYALILTAPGQQNGPIDLLVGTLASRKQAFVQTGLDGVDEMLMLDSRRLALIVREKQRLYYRIIDIPDMKLLLSSEINIG